MSLKLPIPIRNDRLTVIKAAIDAGSGAGEVHFYTTPLPTTTGAAITTQTLLATCALSDPCGSVSNAVLTFDVIADDLAADATGTVAFGRIVDSAGNFVADGDAGIAGSGAVFIFNTLSFIAGGAVRITGAAITEGNG